MRILSLLLLLLSPLAQAEPSRLPAGKPAPTFQLRALDGTLVRLGDMAYPGAEKKYAKKRPVLLDFFRTDCKPCIESLPQLVQVHQKFQSHGLEVLMVALLEDEDGRGKLERFLATQKLPFPVVVDQANHVSKKYLGATVSLPATFLLDRHGVLLKAKYDAKGALTDLFAPEIERALQAQ